MTANPAKIKKSASHCVANALKKERKKLLNRLAIKTTPFINPSFPKSDRLSLLLPLLMPLKMRL